MLDAGAIEGKKKTIFECFLVDLFKILNEKLQRASYLRETVNWYSKNDARFKFLLFFDAYG